MWIHTYIYVCVQVGHIHLQAVEGGTEATAGMGPAFAEHTQHLDAAAAAWLAHWYRLVDMEEAGLLAKKAELWTVAGTPYVCVYVCVWR